MRWAGGRDFKTGIARLCLWLCLGMVAGCGDRDHSRSAYPHKPIVVVVPFAAGGGSDLFVRILQKAIRDEGLLPQPFVIINVPGAGGTVGSRRVKDALADGHTILNLHEGIITAKYSGITAYGPEAFVPIAATGSAGMVVCVADESKLKDLRELMEAAAAEPDTTVFGANIGAPSYFVGRRMEAAVAGSAFRYVQTGGGAKRFGALKGGHIGVTAFSIAEYVQFKGAGLRALAYLGDERHPDAPEIPTAREQGIDVVSTNMQYWWAPRGTPSDRIERLAEALERAMETPFVREKLAEMRMDAIVLRGEALQRELEEREAVVASVGIAAIDVLPDLPRIVMIALAVFGIAVIVQGWRRAARRSGIVLPGKTPPERRLGRLIAVMAISVGYVSGMQSGLIHFPEATLAFVPLLGVAWRVGGGGAGTGTGTGKTVALLLVAGGILGWGCDYLFTEVFVIDLP